MKGFSLVKVISQLRCKIFENLIMKTIISISEVQAVRRQSRCNKVVIWIIFGGACDSICILLDLYNINLLFTYFHEINLKNEHHVRVVITRG